MPHDPTQKRRAAYERGLVAEDAAAAYLQGKGYEVLEKRYKTAVGEIDLIMRDGDYVVAVEVKMRGDLQTALESIRPVAQRRIQNALLTYLADHPHESGSALRFDVVAITPPLHIHHLDNAWQGRV